MAKLIWRIGASAANAGPPRQFSRFDLTQSLFRQLSILDLDIRRLQNQARFGGLRANERLEIL